MVLRCLPMGRFVNASPRHPGVERIVHARRIHDGAAYEATLDLTVDGQPCPRPQVASRMRCGAVMYGRVFPEIMRHLQCASRLTGWLAAPWSRCSGELPHNERLRSCTFDVNLCEPVVQSRSLPGLDFRRLSCRALSGTKREDHQQSEREPPRDRQRMGGT